MQYLSYPMVKRKKGKVSKVGSLFWSRLLHDITINGGTILD